MNNFFIKYLLLSITIFFCGIDVFLLADSGTGQLNVIIYPRLVEDEGAMYSVYINELNEYSNYYESNHVVQNLSPGKTFVRFKDLDGWITPNTEVIDIIADSLTTITVSYCTDSPEIYYATASRQYTDKVQLYWQENICVDSYSIYRSLNAYGTDAILIADNVTENIFSDFSALPGIKYFYLVKPSNGIFSSPVSGIRSLEYPLNVHATDGEYFNEIYISWDSVIGAIDYEVWRNSEPVTISAKIIQTVINNTHTDKDIFPGKRYYYWVKASSSVCNSHYSDYDEGYASLGVPSSIHATTNLIDYVKICWESVIGAVDYTVDYTMNDRRMMNIQKFQDENCLIHTNAIPGREYYYRVKAINHFCISEWSNFILGIRALAKPIAHASKREFDNKISITWQAIT